MEITTSEMLDQVKKLITEQAALHSASLAEVKKLGREVPSEVTEKLAKMAADVEKYTNAYTDMQAKYGDLQAKNAELATKCDDLATRLNRKGGAAGEDGESRIINPGKMFVESADFKSFRESRAHEVRGRSMKFALPEGWGVKDILTSNAGAQLVVEQRQPGILLMPDVPLTIRSIIPTAPTGSNAIEYVKETTQTNNAGPQYSPAPNSMTDGAKKNKSDLAYTLYSTSVKTIAHYMKASRQIIDDVAQLQAEINNRLLYFLALEEEEELLLGDGTANSLTGIIPQATAYNTGLNESGDTKIDKIRHALLQVTLSKYLPTNIVLHPTDWHDIELTKTNEGTTGNQGSYLLTNPTGQAAPRLWGYPVLPTLNMTAGDFLVGNFRLGAQIFDRMQANVQIATTNEDDFVKNMLTILAEERIALAVYRADAFIEGSF
jgi:HK97 family phage major capsid protein